MNQIAEMPAKQPQVITEKQLIEKLLSYAIERQVAYNKYPGNFATSQKLDAVLEIISALDEAANEPSPRSCIKKVLKTSLNFHFIAPTKSKKEFITWYTKIEECMKSCRHFLGYRPQIVSQ
jgi:hypothetical protein